MKTMNRLRGDILPKLRRSPDEDLASLRRDRGRVVREDGKAEFGELVEHEPIQGAAFRRAAAQRLQCFPLMRGQIIVEFMVHASASREQASFARLLQRPYERDATVLSPDFYSQTSANIHIL